MRKAKLAAAAAPVVLAVSARADVIDEAAISTQVTTAVTTMGTVAGAAIAVYAAVVIGKKIIGYFRKAS